MMDSCPITPQPAPRETTAAGRPEPVLYRLPWPLDLYVGMRQAIAKLDGKK